MTTDNKKLNILHINTVDNVGGAAKVAYRLKEGFKRKGHKSWMLVGTKISSDPDVKQIPSTNKYLRFGLNYLAYGTQLQYLNFLNSFQIKNRKEFSNTDIVNFHNLHGEYFNFLALPGLTKSKPTVWTLHDTWAITGRCAFSYGCDKWQSGCGNCPDLTYYPSSKRDTSKLMWKLKKWTYQRSNLVIVTPSKWLKNLVENSILAEKEIHIIYNGIDHQNFHPMNKSVIRKQLGLPEDKLILMFIASGGVRNPQKGGDFLFDSLKRLNSKNVFFLNIGSSDELDKIISRDVDHLSIPYINDADLPGYYAASDLLIFPSVAENCPLVVLEAMACGTPVIAFKTGGVPELVEHMKTGYIAEYKNSDDLAMGVELFLSDDNLREKAGILARKKIGDNFTLDQQVDNYLKLYAQILDKKKQTEEQ